MQKIEKPFHELSNLGIEIMETSATYKVKKTPSLTKEWRIWGYILDEDGKHWTLGIKDRYKANTAKQAGARFQRKHRDLFAHNWKFEVHLVNHEDFKVRKEPEYRFYYIYINYGFSETSPISEDDCND